MSTIIIIVSLFLLSLTAIILIKLIQIKKVNKLISNHFLTIRESRAARIAELEEVRAQFDKASANADNLNETLSRIEKFFEASAQNSIEH